MKRSALLVMVCMLVAGCSSKSPGSKDTGFEGIPWGANAQAVAKRLNVAPKATGADALFASYYNASSPRVGQLMEQGFAYLVTGKNGPKLAGVKALKGLSMLDGGKAGYSLLSNGKFAMNLQVVPVKDFQSIHNRLMKRYGVIDKKADDIVNEYESAYFIQWHDADGVILLAREVAMPDASHQQRAAQVIHMDKRLFDAISGELKQQVGK